MHHAERDQSMRFTKKQLLESIQDAMRSIPAEQNVQILFRNLNVTLRDAMKENGLAGNQFAVYAMYLFTQALKKHNVPSNFDERALPFWLLHKNSENSLTVKCMGFMNTTGDWHKSRPQVTMTITADMSDKELMDNIRRLLNDPFVKLESKKQAFYRQGLSDYVEKTGKYD